ncbi:hypothetical protein AVEN_205290-1 [Araneus ventricosus]|uniref:Uncharacterized protein n=1 Tax=Araneus ventricosus TaxID=182803 RepID=A0A4Y2L450_ARAVE|nr:hypothetical protein AVEN_205290-1 [Araneus ventricosus]
MKDWDISVPYLLPRILSFKKRNNTLPAKLPKPNLRTIPLGNVNARWSAWRRSDYFYPEMIPEPDYSDTESEGGKSEAGSEDRSEDERERLRAPEVKNENEDDNRRRRMPPVAHIGEYSNKNESPRPKKIQFSDEELIKPKKPANPYLESMERQKLHKELKFNQKYGKQNGNQRTELQVALEKYTESKIKRDLAASRRSSLEKVLEQQARKIEMHEREGTRDVQPAWIEQLQRQHITKRSDPKTDEFFRVHARVVNNIMNLESNDEDQTLTDSSSGRSSSPSEHSD